MQTYQKKKKLLASDRVLMHGFGLNDIIGNNIRICWKPLSISKKRNYFWHELFV